MPPSMTVFDVRIKRTKWAKYMFAREEQRLVFFDESNIKIDMARRYGRSKGKSRVVNNSPLNTPIVMTILSSVRIDGRTNYTYYQGGTTGDKFVHYLKKQSDTRFAAGRYCYDG